MLPRQRRHDLTEQPRLAVSAAADHHAVGPRLIERGVGVVNRANVAVDDNGDTDRFLDSADERPVGAVAIHLVARATVDGDHLRAQILGNVRELGGVEAAMVPAHAHFHRDGDIDGFDCSGDQACGERQVTHQRRTCVAIDDFLHRAAHVDVDNCRAAICVELGGFGHFAGRASGKLHRDGFLDGIPRRFLQRLARFADHRLAGDHLGDIEA